MCPEAPGRDRRIWPTRDVSSGLRPHREAPADARCVCQPQATPGGSSSLRPQWEAMGCRHTCLVASGCNRRLRVTGMYRWCGSVCGAAWSGTVQGGAGQYGAVKRCREAWGCAPEDWCGSGSSGWWCVGVCGSGGLGGVVRGLETAVCSCGGRE